MKKIAVITGASSGMGKIFAKEIYRRYVNIEEVWLIARREDLLMELGDEIGQEHVLILPLDLTKDEDVEKYRKELKEREPQVCILVNCAGYGKIGTLEEVSFEHNRGMIRLNCQALTDVTYLTLPYIRKGGQIIELASSAAFLPQPGFSVYAATKSFVLSLSEALRCEVKDREISVTAVCPGPVRTEFFDVAEEGTSRKMFWIKKFFMANPEKVVWKALNDARNGKERSVYGAGMKAFAVLTKIIPHKILLKFISL